MACLTLRLSPDEARSLSHGLAAIGVLTHVFASRLAHAAAELEAMQTVSRLDEQAWHARELMSAAINPRHLIDF
jgi:hypothetical protein